MELISIFQIFLIVSLIFIVFSLTVLIVFSIRKDTVISFKNFIILYFIFTFGIVLFAYCFEPADFMRWDILEHYKELDNIRNIGWSYCVNDSQYSKLPVCMIYYYLISLTGNYHLLPVLPFFTEMMVFLYLFIDQTKLQFVEAIPVRKATLTFFSWFCSYGFLLALSGIRCVWAVSIAFLGLYLEYYKRQHRVAGIILMVMGILIHPAVAILFAVRVAVLIPLKKTLFGAMMVFVLLGTKIMLGIMLVIPISFFQYVVMLMFKYWDGLMINRWFLYVTNSSRTIYLCFVAITVFQFFLLQKIRSTFKSHPEYEKENHNGRLVNIALTILIFQIVGLFNYLFTERIMYITAYNFLLLIPIYVKYAKKNEIDTIFTFGMIFIFAWLFFFNDLYRLLVNYSGVYFLAM